MARESRTVVIAAIVANVAIATAKAIAAAITGSSAILSEAVHSLVDTGDSLLLMLGLHLSKRPPDEEHPFGHGLEIYFWSLVVAMMIFGAGGGISVYEGIRHILHPHPIKSAAWSYGVLGVAAVFEAISWFVSRRALVRKREPGRSLLQTIRASKDPSNFTVFLEDSAALVGIAIAAAGIFGSEQLGLPVLDGVASILIGCVLAAVAMLLARETRGLMLGQSVDADTLGSIRSLASADPAVTGIRRPLTMYFGPDNVLLAVEVEFKPSLETKEVAGAVQRMEERIRGKHPQIRHIFIETASITRPAP